MRVIFSQSLCTAENANSTDSVSKYVSCCYFCFLLPKFITVGQCSLMNRGGLTWLSPPFACMTLSGPVSSGTVLSYGVGCICHVNAFSSCSIDKRCHLDSILRKTRTSASLISPFQFLLLTSVFPSGLFLLCRPHG